MTFRTSPRDRYVALTVDDGPTRPWTPQVHRLLAQHGAKATFFVGERAEAIRPPYGRIDSVGLAVCADLHYGVLLWSGHTTGSNARNDVSRVLRDVSPGSVILAHGGGAEPNATLMHQLDRLVGSLKDDGYQSLTASELLAVPGRGTA